MHRVGARRAVRARVVSVLRGGAALGGGEEPQHSAVQLQELPPRGCLERLRVRGERAGQRRYARQVVRRRRQTYRVIASRKHSLRFRRDDGRRRRELACRRRRVARGRERELGGHAQAFAFEERARELVACQHVVLALVDDGRFADLNVGGGHRSAAVGLEHAHPV